MLHYINTSNAKHFSIAEMHMQEEFAHDIQLRHATGVTKESQLWDPMIESSSSWFCRMMESCDELERIVLIYLVVESCADSVYQKTAGVFENDDACGHFNTHLNLDESHSQLGTSLLEGLSSQHYGELAKIQHKGWQVLEQLFARFATLVKGEGA
ncbi:hypothetical protein [Piscirickettsia litoralis]|uniref:Iron-containing redox enzyme family protein n=1 Tax=Piscirickettsia litoralis TaxID=1891921 RepID=A0ABX3A1B7_9GAMM|nr:hypothetical protein [Piscirickettsia litoralis]ODN41245.1 hypothetical protein BGC07_17685 [Piscirickettsia litoralis]